jgi:hypothetical protein
MQTVKHTEIPERLRVVVTLARLLQTLDNSSQAVGADQYRSVVDHLTLALNDTELDEALDAVLRAYPSTAELYENLHYAQAGLCRVTLERATRAELAARSAITAAQTR